MDIDLVTSPEMRDGIPAISGHHVCYRNSVWLYLGMRRGASVTMVLQNARGRAIAAQCLDCTDAEPRF